MPLTKPSGIITLLSDLGLDDPAVGVLKGAVLSRFGEARLIDLCHHIPPGDVATAALFLADAHRAFPAGTVHLAAISTPDHDSPPTLVAEVEGHYFIAPDLGVLGLVLSERGAAEAELRRLDPVRWGASATASGADWLDRMAPAAAELAGGRFWISELGPPAGSWATGPFEPIANSSREGRVVARRAGGTWLTNLCAECLIGLSEPAVVALGLQSLQMPIRVGPYGRIELISPPGCPIERGLTVVIADIAVGSGRGA